MAVALDTAGVLVSFRPDVALERDDDALRVAHPWGQYRLRGLAPGENDALAELAAGPVDVARLGDGARLRALLDRLGPLLQRTVAVGGRPLATSVPMGPDALLHTVERIDAETTVGLARFAYLHRSDDASELVLESPLARHRVLLHDPAAAALAAALGQRTPVGEVVDSGLGLEAAIALVGLLVAAGLAEVDEEAHDATLALWDFHDLVFHARSRLGRHDRPFGGLYRHQETMPPLPPTAPPRSDAVVELPRPEWDDVVARDPTLTEALESRRSVRDYGDEPITLAQLGELLYRAARVRGIVAADPAAGMPYDAVSRPFPTGGGSGELELYLTVNNCDGLEAGSYHYDAAAHVLRRLDASEQDRRELLAGAWRAAAGRVDPQVLITITSRFGRVSWKYSSIAYALTLKHVGVLYQTLYLVATAMGLAPCALGSGNADAAARAFGLDWAAESSVGEFLIGSRPADATATATRFVDLA